MHFIMELGLYKKGSHYQNGDDKLANVSDFNKTFNIESSATSFGQGCYFYIQNDTGGSGEDHGRKVGDTFASLVSDYSDGVQVRYSPGVDKWVHTSIDVSAGDVIKIWGTTRHIYKNAKSTSPTTGQAVGEYRVKMPLYWRCDENKVIKEIFPDVYHDSTYSEVTAQNYSYTATKESPLTIVIPESGYIYFNAYVGDLLAAGQDDGSDINAVIDNACGVVCSSVKKAVMLDQGSVKLENIAGYSDEYTNESWFYDNSVDYDVRMVRAAKVRRFIQDAINFAGSIGTQLVFPKDKTFVVHIDRSISLPPNFTLDLNGSTIQAFPHKFNGTDVVVVPFGSQNVTIKNGSIFGDNNHRVITHSEYNFAIHVAETNCHIKNVKAGHVAGDGILVLGNNGWNHLKAVLPSTLVRGTINTDSDSLTHEYVSGAGTFTSGSSNSIATRYLNINYYKATLAPRIAAKCSLVPRPTLRIPDLSYKVSRTYKCVYYSLNANAGNSPTDSDYTFISHQGGLTWGDQLIIPDGATHFRLVFDLDKSMDGTNVFNDSSSSAFVIWISLVSPIYGVHIDNCEILYCGRNGINPTGARKIVIDKCLIHDVYGTNNCVGIDFENTSYIDKDCIVRDTKIWRCGSRYQYNPPHSAGNGGSIALAQGSHYIIDNCEFDGIWGGNEDVHILNCICGSIKLSARGGVNVLGVKNTVDNCIVSGSIKAYNTIVKNCEIGEGYSEGSVNSIFEDCVIYNNIGPGIYHNCKIGPNTAGGTVVGLAKNSNKDSYTVLNSCTIDASGLESHNYKSPIIDLINCTVYKAYRSAESGHYFGGTFRKVIGNTFHLHGKKSGSVTNTNPWRFTAATDGLTFTDNRIHYYEDYYDGVTAAYTNGKQKPIYIDFTSCQKPSIISDNIVEQIDEDVAPFKAAIGNEDVLFYDNTFDADFKLTTDITLVSNVYSGKVYRKNTKQVRGYQHEYEKNSRIIEVNDSKMPTPIIRCNNNGTVTVNGTGYAFDIDIEEYTYGGSDYVLSDTFTESRAEDNGVYSYTLESGAADKKVKFTTHIPADSVHFVGNEISVEYEIPSKAPSPTFSVSTVDINNKKITVNLPPVTYMADTHTVVFEVSADNETWETINDTSYKITKATPAVNHYFRAHTDKGSDYYADSDYVTQTIEF